MELTEFEALSFDCYGTLIDWEAGLLAVLGPWARARGLALTGEELLTAYAQVEAEVEAEHPAAVYPEVLARGMRQFGASLGAEVTEEDAARLARSVPGWSNVDRASFAGSNARLGVEFTSIITAQDVGSYKPSPRNFEALAGEAARLGIRPGGLLHVAQSLFHDHVPAKRAGLPTVWIHRRQDRGGWGATPQPPAPVTPDWEFPSMAAFAAAAESRP